MQSENDPTGRGNRDGHRSAELDGTRHRAALRRRCPYRTPRAACGSRDTSARKYADSHPEFLHSLGIRHIGLPRAD
jgi:hypothetical protein